MGVLGLLGQHGIAWALPGQLLGEERLGDRVASIFQLLAATLLSGVHRPEVGADIEQQPPGCQGQLFGQGGIVRKVGH